MSQPPNHSNLQSLAEIIANVLLRQLTEDKAATRVEKTGSSPERMAQHTAP